jgi:CIC family chloride channel protein
MIKTLQSVNNALKKQYKSFINYTQVSQSTYIIILACIIGIVGGFGAVGFRMLIDLFQKIAIGSSTETIQSLLKLPWQVKLIVPVVGALIVGPLIYFFAREAKGHGVPEVMHDVALKNGVIRPRVVLVKCLASAITIATGGSVGREGPIVQIGSALGSTIGQWLKVSAERLKILVGCGAAAGIAATFNAPIAGAFFSLEIILGNFALPSFSPIIISSVLATAVSRAFLGDFPAFIVPEYSLKSPLEIPLYVILGLITGVVAVLFTRLIYYSEDAFDKLPVPEFLKNPIGGLLIGAIIIFIPNVYGVGYETIDLTLSGNLLWKTALLLILIKLLATSITLGSGGSGGIFAPSLFLGAVTGGAFGMLVNSLFPSMTAHSGAYALVGMGAVVAGATHAPITAILILFELTGDYKIILAVMIACTISTIMSGKLYKHSIYTLKLARRGIIINQGREEIIMKSFSVGEVMKTETPAIHETTSLNDIIQTFMKTEEPYYYVIDNNRKFLGILFTHVIKSVLDDKSLQHLIIARDLMDSSIKPVLSDKNLAECMDLFSRVEWEHLPVVDGEESEKLIGSISRRNIFDLYNREILRKDLMGLKLVRETSEEKKQSHVALPKEHEIEYITLPEEFIGKTISELDIRAKYNITIVGVKKRAGKMTGMSEIPSPETLFEEGDILIVVGKGSDIKSFRKLSV